jgi:hypothetical protein
MTEEVCLDAAKTSASVSQRRQVSGSTRLTGNAEPHFALLKTFEMANIADNHRESGESPLRSLSPKLLRPGANLTLR